MTRRRRSIWPLILLLCLPGSAGLARVGYGYKRGEDPLIVSVKRIVLHARKAAWPSVQEEFKRLGWQFKELRDDLGVDIEPSFEKAIEEASIRQLSREISRLLYYAIQQKFHWNRIEKCEKYVPAKSRVEAALYYYDEILSIGVRDHDRRARKKKTTDQESGDRLDTHREILAHFENLRKSIGSSGLFGIGARKPRLKTFASESRKVLEALQRVYPFVVPRPPRKGEGEGASPDVSGGKKREGEGSD